MTRSNDAASSRSITGGGADFLQLDVRDAPRGGRAQWLAGRLRDAIADGRLPVGARLPATRTLAADLRVSRGVVTEAYRRLVDDGHITGRGRAGTVVVAAPLAVPPAAPDGPAERRTRSPAPPPEAGERPGEARPFHGAPDRTAFDALRRAPARIDLTPGLPDLTAFPRTAWLRAERAVLTTLPASGLGYGDPRGAPALRAAVAAWLARNRGVRADPADIVITNGTAQVLGLLARVLRDAGTGTVAIEDPGSLGTRQHLDYWGTATPPVPVDADGVRVDRLHASGAPAVLLTPAHQFPTGAVLSGPRRRALIGWARDGGLIIEDDYDAEHRYDRPPVPALRSMLADRVFYAGSASKLLAPALRTGWLLPPPAFRDAVIDAKRNADLGGATLPQLVLARLMDSGELERQLRYLRRRHRERRDAMIRAIAAHLPAATVHGAAAGLHLTVTLGTPSLDATPGGGTGGADADRAVAAAALERGVKLHPLSWHCLRPHPPGLVLGYAAATPAAITDGIATIAPILRDLGLPGARTRPARTRPART
ncbi:MocR-like pyridoxine biosynthesis transcription factor PdxR [Actinomadura algeriensis]|uniref:GntR family transcriptional regulator/MocR family aminotransferase n=1 Tax=Actinomadura algeriensis TaxID=1679523 RepID=A0ABR9K0J9_9ACTN|nr:PLP-dependent aminotransferase family protein [Actinomadura algeriensis]MBE1536345.1 GntR family transcriptional regulator/MocR family aminotransferase [Actinomadura algeriensis]